jgi:hypothetical protein
MLECVWISKDLVLYVCIVGSLEDLHAEFTVCGEAAIKSAKPYHEIVVRHIYGRTEPSAATGGSTIAISTLLFLSFATRDGRFCNFRNILVKLGEVDQSPEDLNTRVLFTLSAPFIESWWCGDCRLISEPCMHADKNILYAGFYQEGSRNVRRKRVPIIDEARCNPMDSSSCQTTSGGIFGHIRSPNMILNMRINDVLLQYACMKYTNRYRQKYHCQLNERVHREQAAASATYPTLTWHSLRTQREFSQPGLRPL